MHLVSSDKHGRFHALYAPHADMLRGYVHRMIGHPSDAQDLAQDIALKALERFDTLDSERAFKSWLFRIATTTCIDHLRKKARWRPYSQSLYEQTCKDDDELRGDVVAATRDPQFAYDVREHISFCFTCVGRSLDPEEATAVMLREVMGCSNLEAADLMELSEPMLRHRLSAGRQSMRRTFEGLCALVNKDGVCWQCSSFRRVTTEGKRGPSLPVLRDDPWEGRLEIVRGTHFKDGVASILHDVMFKALEKLEAANAQAASDSEV
jgi:RNA polymerase sigma-70 factor (ECF subfamily)